MARKNTFLTELYRAGKPLLQADMTIAPGHDVDAVIARLNTLAPDLEASRWLFYALSRTPLDEQTVFACDLTREAAERLFGWTFVRKQRSSRPDGHWWTQVRPPQRRPEGLEMITRMAITQPGADDDGLDDLVQYELVGNTGYINLHERAGPVAHDVWRQDDNGNRFFVRTFPSWSEAISALRELESHHHRQFYWIDLHR
jgi:hypothetical protein